MSYKIELLKRFNAKANWDCPESLAEIVSAFTNYRLIIEEHGLKDELRYLNLFCNWSAHNNLTKSNTGFKILEEFNRVIVDSFNMANITQDVYFERVKSAFSLDRLRNDILSLNKKLDISFSIISHSLYFNRICDLLLFTLIDREISFSSDIINGEKKNKYYEKIISYAGRKTEFAAISFKLSKVNIYKNYLSFIVKMAGTDTSGRNWQYIIPYVPYHNSIYF